MLFYYGDILTKGRAEWLKKYSGEIAEKCRLVEPAAREMNWHVTVSDYTPQQAWHALREYNEDCRGKDDHMNAVDHAYVNSLLRFLSNTNIPSDEEICEGLRDEGLSEEWLEIWLIDLAGLRRMPQAMHPLVEKLQTDTDYLRERTVDAIVRTGDFRAIDLIDRTFAGDRWDVKLYSTGVPIRFKCARSEEFFLHHLDHEEDATIRTLLCEGLCKQFSKRGVDVVRKEIYSGYDRGMLSLEEMLVDVATVLDIPSVEFALWRLERRAEDERQAKRREQLRESMFLHPGKAKDAEISTAEPEEKSRPIRRNENQAGRNDPCPCGSGKKYKKCCNAPGA